MVLVILKVCWILPDRLEYVFKRTIEVMQEEMTDIIRFSEQPSPWRLTVNLRDVQSSYIAGVASPITHIGKQSFWHTNLDALFLVYP